MKNRSFLLMLMALFFTAFSSSCQSQKEEPTEGFPCILPKSNPNIGIRAVQGYYVNGSNDAKTLSRNWYSATCAGDENQFKIVITSYSIHYTKLYELFKLRIKNSRRICSIIQKCFHSFICQMANS